MIGSIIFFIALWGGSELINKYVRKIKTKYSPEEFKKKRPIIIAISFLIGLASIVLFMMLYGLANGKGLQLVFPLKSGFLLWLALSASVLIFNAVDVLLDRFFKIPAAVANKKQTISTKQAWLILLIGLLLGAVARILLPLLL